MLQDPNVERYIEEATEPLKKEIQLMKLQIEALNQALRQPAVIGELTCDSCGCHPNVIYTTSKGRFCEMCKPAS